MISLNVCGCMLNSHASTFTLESLGRIQIMNSPLMRLTRADFTSISIFSQSFTTCARFLGKETVNLHLVHAPHLHKIIGTRRWGEFRIWIYLSEMISPNDSEWMLNLYATSLTQRKLRRWGAYRPGTHLKKVINSTSVISRWLRTQSTFDLDSCIQQSI